jgi:hypothetical protein
MPPKKFYPREKTGLKLRKGLFLSLTFVIL